MKKNKEEQEVNTFQRGIKKINADTLAKVEFTAVDRFIKGKRKISFDSLDTKTGKIYGGKVSDEKEVLENIYKGLKQNSGSKENIDILENSETKKNKKVDIKANNNGLYITVISVVVGVIVVVIGAGVFLSKK